jgi:hypothetical protein
MEENFKQKEKILDIMDSNIDARLALYESIKHTSFKEGILLLLKRWLLSEYIEHLENKLAQTEQLIIADVVSSLPSECQENWESDYYCTLSGKCQKCEMNL